MRRRILQYGLQEQACFSEIDNRDLDAITRQFVDPHPNSGVRSLAGFLRGMGLKIQRSRVRDSLMRIDHRGIES